MNLRRTEQAIARISTLISDLSWERLDPANKLTTALLAEIAQGLYLIQDELSSIAGLLENMAPR